MNYWLLIVLYIVGSIVVGLTFARLLDFYEKE
jgi:glycerol-3-phosphate acyltransferase PlsY